MSDLLMLGDYKRDGYCILRGAVMASQTMTPEEHAEFYEQLRKTFRNSVDEYLQKVRQLSKLVDIHRMFTNAPIYMACRELGVRMPLFLSDPAVHVIAEDMKIPGGYDGVGAHQDWPALQASLNAIVVWIPFHNVGVDNFPVEVVPGSHKRGLLPAEATAHYSEVDTTGMDFVPVEVRRGDALLFSVFTVHRTRTPGRGLRIAYSQRYHDGVEKNYVEHGYHAAQRRVIDREVKWQPTAKQVSEAIGC